MLGLVVAGLLALLLMLLVTDSVLSVWQQLSELPIGLRIAYFTVLGGISLGVMYLAWRWLKPKPEHKPAPQTEAVSTEALEEQVVQYADQGINVDAAISELEEQKRRKRSGEIYIAVFGEISSGKSTLVNALVPEADAESDPRGGTTVEIKQYCWNSEGGDRVLISDLPGFNLGHDEAVLQEAGRSHLVVFVCDGDLAQSQHEELARLQELSKPIVLAINKIDRLSEDSLTAIRLSLAEKTALDKDDIVAIRSGGKEQVIRLLSDGSEKPETRDRQADVEALRLRIQAHLDENRELMESLRDSAVLLQASNQLEQARSSHQAQQAQELVATYSRRAVIGALAAVAPGSDLVIQGILATRLMNELCELYDVPAKEIQIESFLKLAGGKVRRMSALTLAITGNALKAFPGVGTLSGGLVHAVAYGMIFDSLGRAAAETLASRGELRPLPAARTFEDLLSENLESGAGRFAKLALAQRKQDDPA